MELSTVFLLALAFVIFRLRRFFLPSKARCDLPGPSFLTVLSNFHLFGTTQHHKLFAEWSRKYGKIFTFNLFGQRFVVVSTPDLIKAAYSVDERTGNVPKNPFEVSNGGSYGIGGNGGKIWAEQRKFTVHNLKYFGFSRTGSSNEQLIKDLDDIIETIAEQCNKPVDQETLQLPILNIVWRVTASTGFTADKMPLLRRFQKYFAAYTFSRKQSVLGPILANFGLETDLMKKYKAVSAEFHQVQQEVVNEHLKVLDEKMEPDDYVDAYLLKMRDEKSRGSSFEGEVGRRNLLGVLMDVNIAGSNTIVHTFQTLLMNMILYPDVQAKLREQVDSVIGSSRAPALEDRKNLPYVEAFILESLRDFTPAPFGFHDAVEDSTLEGHLIPKGTIILGNLWYANHHEEIWEDPMSFKPERFLNSTGDKVQKSEQVMSFSAGKRKCLGFLIAQEALFLLLTRVVQRFIVKEHPDHPITSLEPNLGFFLTAPEFKTLFVDRWSTA